MFWNSLNVPAWPWCQIHLPPGYWIISMYHCLDIYMHVLYMYVKFISMFIGVLSACEGIRSPVCFCVAQADHELIFLGLKSTVPGLSILRSWWVRIGERSIMCLSVYKVGCLVIRVKQVTVVWVCWATGVIASFGWSLYPCGRAFLAGPLFWSHVLFLFI